MLPAVASNVVFVPPQQAPLINTAILGSEVTRVPVDNVPPSVSNAQVENNTKGGPNAFLSRNAPAISTETETNQSFSLAYAARPNPSVNLPTTFLAQLLGQTGSAGVDSITQGILVEYEKLVAISNVKYKPSNALKPPAGEPSGVFGSLLRQNKPVQQPAPQPVQAPRVEAQPQTTTAAAVAAPQPVRQQPRAQNVEASQTADTVVDLPATTTEPQPAPKAPVSPGLNAYLAAGRRNDALSAIGTDPTNDLA